VIKKIQESIRLWQGLEDFRFVLFEIFSIGLNNIKQETLDKLFSSYGFKLEADKKALAIKTIQDQLKMDLSPEDRLEIENYKKELENFQNETIIKKQTEKFEYEMVFRENPEGKLAKNLMGYVKVKGLENSNHLALVTWESHKKPIIFMAEIKRNIQGEKEISFHINYGDSGLAIVWEDQENFFWTHSHSQNYTEMQRDLERDEIGTVRMDKQSKEFELVDSNLAGASALARAKTKTSSGKMLIETNIELMNIYKEDLENFIF
jgi:hypothetical protein